MEKAGREIPSGLCFTRRCKDALACHGELETLIAFSAGLLDLGLAHVGFH